MQRSDVHFWYLESINFVIAEIQSFGMIYLLNERGET